MTSLYSKLWLIQLLSALILIPLLLWHIHWLCESVIPLSNVTFATITHQLSNPVNRVLEALFFIAAATHGTTALFLLQKRIVPDGRIAHIVRSVAISLLIAASVVTLFFLFTMKV